MIGSVPLFSPFYQEKEGPRRSLRIHEAGIKKKRKRDEPEETRAEHSKQNKTKQVKRKRKQKKETGERKEKEMNEIASFYNFVRLRMTVWKRKEEGLAREKWTDDVRLREGHFCNVYRELDRGTKFLLYESLQSHRNAMRNEKGTKGDICHVLYLFVVYRLVNNVDTFIRWRKEHVEKMKKELKRGK